jgi:hypothetical protein
LIGEQRARTEDEHGSGPGFDIETQERLTARNNLFIGVLCFGTQFNDLYTAVDTPAKAAIVIVSAGIVFFAGSFWGSSSVQAQSLQDVHRLSATNDAHHRQLDEQRRVLDDQLAALRLAVQQGQAENGVLRRALALARMMCSAPRELCTDALSGKTNLWRWIDADPSVDLNQATRHPWLRCPLRCRRFRWLWQQNWREIDDFGNKIDELDDLLSDALDDLLSDADQDQD